MTQVEDAITFHNATFCPWGMRAWFTIELKKIPHKKVIIDLHNKTKEFTEVYHKALGHDPNSNGKVPVLEHNGKFLTESLIVCRYLDYIKPDVVPLFPKDPIKKAIVELMVDKFTTPFARGCGKCLYKYKNNLSDSIKELQQGFNDLNEKLLEYSKDGPYLCGKELSLFEIAVFPWVDRTQSIYGFHYGKIKECHIDVFLKGNDRLKLWFNTLVNHPISQKIYKETKERIGMSHVDYWVDRYIKNIRKE